MVPPFHYHCILFIFWRVRASLLSDGLWGPCQESPLGELFIRSDLLFWFISNQQFRQWSTKKTCRRASIILTRFLPSKKERSLVAGKPFFCVKCEGKVGRLPLDKVCVWHGTYDSKTWRHSAASARLVPAEFHGKHIQSDLQVRTGDTEFTSCKNIS